MPPPLPRLIYALKLYLGQKDWQVVFDEWIGVDDGLVQMLVEDFPGE